MKNKKAGKNIPIRETTGIFLKIFAGFILLFLPFFYLSIAIDYTMMPRFLALSIFLLVFGIIYFTKSGLNVSDLSVFRYALFPALALYVLAIIFSMMFSVNFREGIYDLTKTVAFIFLIAIGSLLFIRFDGWREILAKFSIISALIACVIGLVQYFIFVVQATTPFLSDGRPLIYGVVGVMSHKNLFSLSLLILVPWNIYGIFVFRKGWRFVATGSLLLLILMIILLQTRAVWTGILISSTVVFLLSLFFVKSAVISKRMKIMIVTGILLVMGAISVMVVAGLINSGNPYIRQLASIADPKSGQNVNRLKSWSLTVEMIRDNFSTGVGSGNWQIVAPHYFAGRFSDKDELNWIRPHNDFLWVFAEKGIAGILLFMSVFGVSIYYIMVVLRRGAEKDQVLSLCLLWGLSGYMVASVFDFPYERPFHIAALSLFLSAAIAMYSRVKPVKPLIISKQIILIPFVSIGLFTVVFSFSAFRQEVYIKKSLEDAQTEKWQNMLFNTQQATSIFKNLDPWANPVTSYSGKAYEEMLDLHAAEAAYLEAYRLCPTKLKVITNLARIYEKNGKYSEAETMLNEGLLIIPNHPVLLKQKCDVYYAMGDYRKAYNTYKQVQGWENDTLIRRNMKLLESEMNSAKK
ncbi:MAG: hypothetical protein NT004_18155 [Bacteroidetes bacterium]|nr:hypothetical protein [Bacteroidota bacterium]